MNNAQKLLVRADISAFEFREAAWAAADAGGRHACGEPDPSDLSDRALAIALRYEDKDLPRGSHLALEQEWSRRRTMRDGLAPLIAVALMAVVAGGGLIAGWLLFAG